MILADKIINERKKNGWSQEELAEKLSVSRQAVSKWESAQSIPDLQRIVSMAALFGVSTDYLLKEDMGEVSVVYEEAPEDTAYQVRRVSMEEANAFLEMRRKTGPRIADAVSLCILSPVLLIVLCGLAESRIGRFTEALAAGIGLMTLFGMVALAVFMFITNGMRQSRMETLGRDVFETEYGVSGMVREKKQAFEESFTRGIALGVVICILSVVPLIAGGIVDAPDYILCLLVGFMLVMVSGAVNMIIRVCMTRGAYDTLLQEGDYSTAAKRQRRKTEPFDSIYWCVVTAIYLGWSFWTRRWDFTWLVWPVAGVLYAAISGILHLVMRSEE